MIQSAIEDSPWNLHLPQASHLRLSVVREVYVWDEQGKRYLDLPRVGITALGHSSSAIPLCQLNEQGAKIMQKPETLGYLFSCSVF